MCSSCIALQNPSSSAFLVWNFSPDRPSQYLSWKWKDVCPWPLRYNACIRKHKCFWHGTKRHRNIPWHIENDFSYAWKDLPLGEHASYMHYRALDSQKTTNSGMFLFLYLFLVRKRGSQNYKSSSICVIG